MAGLGRKVFTAGEVLQAADVNNYLMDQAVQVYAGTAARGSALGTSVSEGQVVYLSDSNSLEVYDGSQWGQVSQVQSPNYIINGAFDFWQRGTSFTTSVNNATFTADRYFVNRNGSGSTVTVSQQAFTPAELAITNFGDSPFYYRYNHSVAGTGQTYGIYASQKIEDVRTLAGQAITFSFWAKSNANRTIVAEIIQNFGSGGSSDVGQSQNVNITTSSRRAYTNL